MRQKARNNDCQFLPSPRLYFDGVKHISLENGPVLDKCFIGQSKWTSDWREHFDWTCFKKEINCTLCTRFLSTIPFDKTKMCWSLHYFPGTYTRDVPFSTDLYRCVRLLSSWQTFVIFSADWAGWHLHSRLLLLLYCAFNNAQHSFTCSYTIQIICLDFYF